MGYTVMPATDQVGVGLSSIGDLAGAYAANLKGLAAYERTLAAGKLPVERGLLRTADDELRGAVIRRIICALDLPYDWVRDQLGVDPEEHFADALQALLPMAEDGLIELDPDGLRVTPRGRFFLRNICMPFDAHLATDAATTRPIYSRTV